MISGYLTDVILRSRTTPWSTAHSLMTSAAKFQEVKPIDQNQSMARQDGRSKITQKVNFRYGISHVGTLTCYGSEMFCPLSKVRNYFIPSLA
jgi:hypothetical protein